MRTLSASQHLTAAQETAASRGHKGMMPVGGGHGQPFLDYILSALADAGCKHVCLVIGAHHGSIRRYYQDEQPPKRLQVEFVVQETPDGTARALLMAEAFALDDPFLVLNADNLYPPSVLRALIELDGPGVAAFERDALIEDSGLSLARIAMFALLEIDSNRRLTRIDEKPGLERIRAAGAHALVSMNVWRFDRRIFDACRRVPRSARGEFELPEAVGCAISDGVDIRAVTVRGAILDLSTRDDVAYVAERLSQQQAQP